MCDRQVLRAGVPVWALALLLVSSAEGAEKWLDTLNRASILHEQGFVLEAVRVTEQAATEARAAGAAEPDIETIEFQQGLFEIDAGSLVQAAARIEPIFRQREKRLGSMHRQTLLAQLTLGQTYAMMGDVNRGLPLLGPAMRDLAAQLGPDAPEVWAAKTSFGIALTDAGAYDKADQVLTSAASHARKRAAGQEGLVSGIIGHLAMLKAMQNKPKQAERLVREALEMRENAGLLEHPRTIPIYLTQGQVELVLRRPQSAMVALEKARVLAQKFWPPDHPELTTLYAAFGLARLRSGDVKGAEEPLRRALALTEKTLGPNHPTAGAILAMLAEFMQRQNRIEEARRLESRSRDVIANADRTVSVWSLRDTR